MPITKDQMTYEEMKQAARTHVCGECGGRLEVAWDSKTNGYILRCHNLAHSSMTRHFSKSESQIQKEKEWRVTNGMDSTALTKMSNTQMLDRIGMAKFPQELTAQDKTQLAQAAITYGFDPLMGEISIYQGRPYISIDGRYRKAQETEKLDGVETRPASKEERANWQIPDDDYFFRAEVFVKGCSRPFVGWGRVRSVETHPKPGKEAYRPVELVPQRMAEKRAEAQALRKAFHIPLPSIEEIGVEEDHPARRQVDSVVVDKKTGEITDPENNHQAVLEGEPPANKGQIEALKKLGFTNFTADMTFDQAAAKIAELQKK